MIECECGTQSPERYAHYGYSVKPPLEKGGTEMPDFKKHRQRGDKDNMNSHYGLNKLCTVFVETHRMRLNPPRLNQRNNKSTYE
jgi:hypothetical protein